MDARRFVPTRHLASRADVRRRFESDKRFPRFADESVVDESDDDESESADGGDGSPCSLAFDDDKHDDDSS